MPAVHTMHENIKIRGSVSKTIEKLSSGFRINRAADDAAGLGVSESMRSQITELARAQRNVQEGIDVTNTADGALAEINSMLIRARELCIEGANGIYTQPELDAISDELNEIFDDVDRITAGTRHNDIQLFRYEGANLVKKDVKYDYVDHFNKVPDTSTVNWGEMDFIQDKVFGDPEKGVGATVTMTFDDSVDMNDVKSLDGKTVRFYAPYPNYINTTYTFKLNGSSYYSNYINFSQSDTIEDVMNRLVAKNDNLASATVNRSNKTVTFTADLKTLTMDVVNGNPVYCTAIDADGTWANGKFYVSSSERVDPSLGRTEGKTGSSYDSSVSKGPAAQTKPDQAIGEYYYNNLIRNKLQVSIGGYSVSIDLSKLGFTKDTTWGQIASTLAGQLDGKTISGKGTIHASYDAANGLSISADGLSTTSSTPVSISETTTATIPGTDKYIRDPANDQKVTLTCNALNFSTTTISPFVPNGEGKNVIQIDLPDVIPDGAFTVSVAGRTYYYYDSSVSGVFPPADYSYSGTYPVDLKGKSKDEIRTLLYNNAMNAVKSAYTGGLGVEIKPINSGKSFQVTNLTGKEINIPVTATSRSFTATKLAYKENPDYKAPVPGSYSVLSNVNGLLGTMYQKGVSTLTLDLGASDGSGLKNLVGKGCRIESKLFEFVDGTGLLTNYEDIDISGKSLEDIRKYFEDKMGANYTVTLDDTNSDSVKLVISKNATNFDFYDGRTGSPNDGLFTNTDGETKGEYFQGGSDGGYSYTTIDFSSINDDNLETLLGRGFRITCATCEGEYINVFFCWKKDATMPDSFEVTENGQTRTIHNVAVELSKISNGEKIVENIVSQVSPQLKHFTQVEVGTPPTTLIAREARLGDIREPEGDPNGVPKRGSVLSGVKANFEYTYEKVEVKDDPPASAGDGENPTIDYRNMLIYVGSEPDHQWIPIHLPWLDLPTLRLSPPETVDLGGGDDPFDWLKRVDSANGVITAARSRIGADYNRLEHTYSTLTQARENMEDAESRIRDADMAKLMVQYMKDQIIGQAQQSMMLHSNERPQQILELLR